MSWKLRARDLLQRFARFVNRRGGLGGYFLIEDHYSQPIPNFRYLGEHPELFEYIYAPPGLDMNVQSQLELLRTRMQPYASELKCTTELQVGAFPVQNDYFGYVDAQVYYSLIRALRPERIIEVGAGYSTLVALLACERNLQVTGRKPHLAVIEPHPSELLLQQKPRIDLFLDVKAERVPFDFFEQLCANDMLFIDSSHVIKFHNDVVYLLLEVLPRLAPGVIVHLHDITLPLEIHPAIFNAGYCWNEQYLLLALLTHSQRYSVFWASYHMTVRYFDAFRSVFAGAERDRPGGSFYIRVLGP